MNARTEKAFTLAELVLAVSITAVIGLTVATMAVAFSHAQSHTSAMGQAIQSARTAMLNMEATVRKGKLVTGTADGETVVWRGDANDDKEINLDELVLLHYLPETRRIEHWQVTFPQGMSAQMRSLLNVTRPLWRLDKPRQVRELMSKSRYDDYLARLVLATDAEDFDVTTDRAPPFSRLVLLRVTAGPVGQRIKLTNAARLRADAVDKIRLAGNKPVLELD